MQIVDIELHVVNTFYQSYKQKWGGVPRVAREMFQQVPSFPLPNFFFYK